ncbi:MAG: hypothetical protein AB1765_01920 [Candidatus Hydrogenedentota bacterium]
MEWVITFVTLVAGCITIIWFIRDVRKENSKLLKSMFDVQKTSLDVQKTSLDVQKTSLDVQREVAQILLKIEEGQREMTKILSEGQREMTKILESHREGFRVLSEGQCEMTKILSGDMTKLGEIFERVAFAHK